MARPKTPAAERFWKMVAKSGTCWMWNGSKDEDGYGWFSGDGHKKAHRWSYAHHKGEIPYGLGVLHQCDTPSCVNPEHLFLGTTAMNQADKVAKQRQARGESSLQTRLKVEDVLRLRAMYREGVPIKDIGAMLGITDGSVSQVAVGRTWGHIEGACNRRSGQRWASA